MTFATRSKFFWSRFIATTVKYLGVANTQHIRYVAEKILPTEMSRQNILYHVRIAEEKGWIATFASSLEITEENKILFRSKFVNEINEKISAQRFVITGTEPFESELEDKIKIICRKAHLEPISFLDKKVLSVITEDSIKRLASTKDKAAGNKSLFMVLLRFSWFWLNINPKISLNIIDVIKENADKHDYNENYKIDAELLEIVCLIELETTPEISAEDLKGFLHTCIKFASTNKRSDIMNLMAMTLLISGRVLVSFNKLLIAEEYLNRGIKYLRLTTRKSILMRKLHVDGLFDLGFIYSQQGWFYKALSVYENIGWIIKEEFSESEPIDNLRGRLALAKSELYLMMAWPAYTFKDDDYRTSLIKALRFARKANRIYNSINNKLKVTEINLLSAWIFALIGKIPRAEIFLNRGTKELVAPVPAKLNTLYYNALAEIYRKQGKYSLAIRNIAQSFDYIKMIGYLIAKLFCMTRLASLHLELTGKENQYSFISFGDMTNLFEKGISDMISHVFLEFNKILVDNSAIISFYASETVLKNHPEIDNYVEYLPGEKISPALLGESYTVLPEILMNKETIEKQKIICIVGSKDDNELMDKFTIYIFKDELEKFDDLYQKLLSKK
ncbi:MAG TPA: hypothetical protein VMX55_04475 [candidate division Zixibacteria bacterium]|nr:hypothetical protein [candidate division Zixibacteria bacterium]